MTVLLELSMSQTLPSISTESGVEILQKSGGNLARRPFFSSLRHENHKQVNYYDRFP